MTDATELDLDAIRARWTPPKREDYQGPGADIAHSLALMQWSLSRGVESKTDVPALLAALDEARAEVERLRGVERHRDLLLNGFFASCPENHEHGVWCGSAWVALTNRAEAAESSLAAVTRYLADYANGSRGAIATLASVEAALAPTPPDEGSDQ